MMLLLLPVVRLIPFPLKRLMTRRRIIVRLPPLFTVKPEAAILLPLISTRVAPPVLPSMITGALIAGSALATVIVGFPLPMSNVMLSWLGLAFAALMASRKVQPLP